MLFDRRTGAVEHRDGEGAEEHGSARPSPKTIFSPRFRLCGVQGMALAVAEGAGVVAVGDLIMASGGGPG